MDASVARDRLRRRFDRWDSDRNGVLTRSDFEREGNRIARAFGEDLASPEARRLRSAFSGMFDFFSREADGSVSISAEHMMRVGENLIHKEDEEALDRLLRPMLEAIVSLCDENVYGYLNEPEFAAWLSALGVPEVDGRAAFRRIDQFGFGELSIEELLAAVRSYHLGELDVELLGRAHADDQVDVAPGVG